MHNEFVWVVHIMVILYLNVLKQILVELNISLMGVRKWPFEDVLFKIRYSMYGI